MSEPIEFYLFRDGEKQGPFDQAAIDQMLLQGTVQLTDHAWRQGLTDWTTLGRALERDTPPEPPAAPQQSELRAITPAEPATAKQKAFLSYMGIAVPERLTKSKAALLVNDAMENPSDPARLAKWHEDRLRLHPEIFAAELQAMKENRPNYFYERVMKDGAECFHDVGKAHCQVLVGYLDVKFPNWDARDSDATWDYFFPAIAERFPQLVTKAWKGRLKYPQGPRVASELSRSAPTAQVIKRQAPLFSGVALAWIFILLLMAGGLFYLKQHGLKRLAASREGSPANSSAEPGVAPPATNSGTADGSHGTAASATAPGAGTGATQLPPPAPLFTPPASISGSSPATAVNNAAETAPLAGVPGMSGDPAMVAAAEPAATAPMAGLPGMTGIPGMAEAPPAAATAPMAGIPGMSEAPAAATAPMAGIPGMAEAPAAATAPMAGIPGMSESQTTPAAPNSGTGALFTPPPPAGTASGATVPPAPSTTASGGLPPAPGPTPRASVKLIKPVTVQMTYGQLTIPQGTSLKVVSQEPNVVKVAYMNTVIPLPLQVTDLIP